MINIEILDIDDALNNEQYKMPNSKSFQRNLIDEKEW